MAARSLAVLGAILVLLGEVRPAHACGGFFCSQVPVQQRGEHLLFGIEDGSVVAHVQIRYEGAAEEFAWVLPLPAEPEVSLGSDWVFWRLRETTAPSFELDWSAEGSCTGSLPNRWVPYPFRAPGGGGCAGLGLGLEGEGEVEVLSEGSVGPYETRVVRSDDAGALVLWLEDNDYALPESSHPLIQAYVDEGAVFVALRLQKDRSVGDLQPIVLRFPESGPCIPLRLTSIAATPDMPIFAWVLAEHRVVSTNFLDVEVDPAAIDWWNGGANYGAVVSAAADEAWGRALVTEYAGPSSILRQVFFREGQYDLEALRAIEDPAAFVFELTCQGFPSDSVLRELLRRFIPMPQELVEAGVTEQEFYNCLECWSEALAGFDLDTDGFVAALDESLVGPLREVQEMADRHPFLTRLYTTISAAEMTEDPLFRQNPDLPEVPLVHRAEGEFLCGEGRDYREAPFRLVLPDGRVLVYDEHDAHHPGTTEYSWLDADGDGVNDDQGEAPADLPAARRATRQGESGPGEILLDNDAEIDRVVAERYGPAPPGAAPDPPAAFEAHGGGCAVAGIGGGSTRLPEWGPPVPAVFALVAWRLRRR